MSEDLTVDANKEINRKFCSTSAETLDTVPAIVVSNEWEDSVCHSPPSLLYFLENLIVVVLVIAYKHPVLLRNKDMRYKPEVETVPVVIAN